MKKVLAVVLALCMVFAMGTVAFAATVQTGDPDNHDTNPETVLIQTSTDDVEDTYTVTIPADVTLPWNTTAGQTLTANVKGHITAGKTVNVSVAMPASLDLAADKLTVTTSDAIEITVDANAIIAGQDLVTNYSVSGYDLVPIGVYSGVAQYTVIYA